MHDSSSPYAPPSGSAQQINTPPAATAPPAALRQSWLGISSFVMSIIFGLIMFGLVVASAVLATREGGMSEDSVEAIVIGLAILGCGFAILVGLGLGIAGLFQPQRSKVFSILGIIFNAAIVLVVGALFVIGMTVT